MSPRSPTLRVALALREARLAHGFSIATLASMAGVSPRLVSDFELGKRPNVSLETALRLLELVDSSVFAQPVASATDADDEHAARAARAARRRATWSGEKTSLTAQSEPTVPAVAAARLVAVADASQLAVGLQVAQCNQTRSLQVIGLAALRTNTATSGREKDREDLRRLPEP